MYDKTKLLPNGCHQNITAEPGRPVDVCTPETVQAVENLFKSDRRLTLDVIAKILGLPRGTAYTIVHEKLGFPKVSSLKHY